MSESMKDKFLKEHELSLEELEQVGGGNSESPIIYTEDGAGWGTCMNPACSHYNRCVAVETVSGIGYRCVYCMNLVDSSTVDIR